MKTLKHMHQRIRKDITGLLRWGYHVDRIADGWVYHLEHVRGENSWFTNPHMQSNMDEWNKIQSMSKQQLKEYYSQQDYLKKYVSL